MLNKIEKIILLYPEIAVGMLCSLILLMILYVKIRRRKRLKLKSEQIIGKYKTKRTLSGLEVDPEDPSKAYSINNELEQVIISLFNELKFFKRKPYNYLEKIDGNLKLRNIDIKKPLTHKMNREICSGREVFTNEIEKIDFDKNSSLAILSQSGIGKTTFVKVLVAQANQLKFRIEIITSHNMDFPYKTLNPFVHEEKFSSILDELTQRIKDNENAEPTLLILDEIQAWLPGQPKEVKKAIEDIINQGRKFGVYIVLASQTVALGKLSAKIGIDISTVSYVAIGGFPNDATLSALGVPPIKRIYQKDLRGLFYCGRSELKPIKIFSQVKKAGLGELVK
ncbi:MAG: AAA family ATPase [Bdellovibrionales bacterium]